MRILIGCQEICGWINLLETGFKKQGHQVITVSGKCPYFKEIKYTVEKENFEKDYFNLRISNQKLANFCFKIYLFFRKVLMKFIKRDISNRVYRNALNFFYNNTDLYLHIWESFDTKHEDLAEFKKRNIKIVSWFVGDDIRYYPIALKEFNVENDYFLEHTKSTIYTPMRKLRMHEKYSDAIFSVPDQSSLALRPYFHLQIPIDLSKYTFKKTGNAKPLIFHIPSAPLLKGSPIFFKVIEELTEEGLDFEFKTITGISNREVREILTEADILLDELYMHGPGMLGMEAMASGCCVVVKFLESSPPCFRPPVVSVTPNTLKNKLRELIVNKKLREELIVKGKSYVESNNKVADVCGLIINKINSNDFDYYPSYFRQKFEIDSDSDIKTINKLTLLVKDCDWYHKFVKPGVRGQLVF